MPLYFLVAIDIIALASAQLMLKKGVSLLGAMDFSLAVHSFQNKFKHYLSHFLEFDANCRYYRVAAFFQRKSNFFPRNRYCRHYFRYFSRTSSLNGYYFTAAK